MAQTHSWYVLMVNTDTVEGLGPSRPCAYFRNMYAAVSVCNDQRFYSRHGVMGTPCDAKYVVQEHNITVYDSAEEYWEKHNENVKRENALKKLTAEERRLLGLN